MASKIKDSRMSFMSGHATFAFQAMTFAVLYLQARGNFCYQPLKIQGGSSAGLIKFQAKFHPISRRTFVVPFLQLAFFAMAFGTTLTRITDNKHHPADLVVGALIGMLMQVLCKVPEVRTEKQHIEHF